MSFYAEISESTFADKSVAEISILQNLVTIAGIGLDNTNHFKGEMKCLDKEKIPKSYELEYAEILVKVLFCIPRTCTCLVGTSIKYLRAWATEECTSTIVRLSTSTNLNYNSPT